MSQTDRMHALQDWLHQQLGRGGLSLRPASEDASFRRYFRVGQGGVTHIVMDAPPGQEDIGPFLDVSQRFFDIGLHVPEVFAVDRRQGFILLSDLGSRLYLDELSPENVGRLYGDALGALAVIQACGPGPGELPDYDHDLLRREMELFRDWLVGRHLALELSESEQSMLDDTFQALSELALAQPRVCVHRDYHSRNLMVTEKNNPGILDYQDAVVGPVTYDLVSLLRDCYIAWPKAMVHDWALGYQELALQSGVISQQDETTFLRWFDWMGVQRHLKAAGIFARLFHRDGKPGYLPDIPRTLAYIVDAGTDHEQLQPLCEFLQNRVLPGLAQKAG